MPASSTSADSWLAATTTSHQRLSGIVGQLAPGEVAGPSYCTDWSIAQVLSHLGSGAEIFTLFFQAGLAGKPAPGEFQPIWERWNAKSPAEQAADALRVDRAFLDQLVALDDQARQSWRIDMFGEVQDLSGLLRFRLGEHAVHTWDVAVTRDAAATLAPDAVALLIDTVHELVARAGHPPADAIRLSITTVDPVRRFLLVPDGEAVALLTDVDDVRDEGTPQLELPAEALLRLVYGRLDPQHTPTLAGDQGMLDVLRRTFPGF